MWSKEMKINAKVDGMFQKTNKAEVVFEKTDPVVRLMEKGGREVERKGGREGE